jgi:drug/metabolite transporter (DMT)-like permease
VTLRVFIALITGCLCASLGTFLLKLGAVGRTHLLDYVNAPLVCGFALYGLGGIFWVYGLSSEPLTVVYPFTALTFVLVLAGAVVFFQERPTASAWIGMAFVLIGIGLIVRGRQG